MARNVDTAYEVLVTDGHTRAGLAVARSLARRAVRLLVLVAEPGCPAMHSRLLNDVVLAPSPAKETNAFIEFTLQTIAKHKIELAIPITDQALLLFDQQRAVLRA